MARGWMPFLIGVTVWIGAMVATGGAAAAVPDDAMTEVLEDAMAAPDDTDALPPESFLGTPLSLADVHGGSLLFRTTQEDAFLAAPTLATEVVIRVTGFLARTQVRQRFHNPTEDWLEGVYVFPLPENAAVDTLEMQVGERTIVGQIHEREEAQEIFEEARREGRKASLLEQERPNVFTTTITHIGPDEEIEVVIAYQNELRYDSGRFTLRFPLVVAPRYVPGCAGEDAEPVSPPVAPPGTDIERPVDLLVELEAGFAIDRIESPTHRLWIEEAGPSRFLIELAGAPIEAESDFVLTWEPAAGEAPQAALFAEELEGERYLLLMMLPPRGEAIVEARLPRETVFVIDTSGSMDGTSIRQARQALALALDRLAPEDAFNIIQFNSNAESLFPQSVPAEPRNLERARRYVRRLDADGGTEMLLALTAALEAPPAFSGVLRQVIFITDGSVGNEAELFAYIQAHLGDNRLFTVAIGSAPNSHFMSQAAAFGRGSFTYIASVEEVEARMTELLHKLESPVLTDVELRWDDPGVEAWPERIPDLYAGEPVVVVARQGATDGAVTLSGWRGASFWEHALATAGAAPGNGLAKLWARRKIAALVEHRTEIEDPAAIQQAVVELGMQHHLVSEFTSLVAVDVTPTAPADVLPQVRRLPVHLPAGWNPVSFVELPQGGTGSFLQMGLGLVLLLISAHLARMAWRSGP